MINILNSYLKWVDRLNKVLVVLVGLILIVMTLSIAYQVCIRFILTTLGINISAPWTEELARYLMITLVFLGAAIAVRKSRLIAVETLLIFLPPWPSKIVRITAHIIGIIFYIYALIIGYKWAIFGLTEVSTVMKFSMFYVYLTLPICALIMIINTLAYLIETFIFEQETDSSLSYDL